MKNRILIEVCCGSVEDAVNAAQAGANRVELNSALILGGLTPSIGELSAVKERIGIPVICMVRPRGGGFCYTELEFETMKRDAAALIKEGADGIAFGFLNQDGGLDIDRTARFIETVCPGEAVFHRAFDSMTGSQADAIDKLAAAGVKRILTSGRKPSSLDGVDELRRYVELARGRLDILAGGGVRPANALQIIERTGCRQIHFTFHKDCCDYSATYNKDLCFESKLLPPPENVRVVDKEKLAEFIKSMPKEL